ncbi:DUF2871 family protein [Streptococcus henryi]|uniref:DUF2871 family protein n=1 Tax=Streptococcus henryi TaxID=439219 RepID=UPI0009DA3E9B|nr:DUF2871 family protein [Streptococcus henryi]
MKKYLNLAYIYAIAALVAGVFYREFTKRINLLGTEKIIKTWKGGNSHVKYKKNRTNSPLRAFKS